MPPAEPAEPPEQPSCLVPELLCEYLKIPKSPTEVTLMLKVRPPRTGEPQSPSAPSSTGGEPKSDASKRDHCLVLVCSGSMKKHLPLLKETLQFMVQQLRSSDKLCVVTFDHEVRRMQAAYS